MQGKVESLKRVGVMVSLDGVPEIGDPLQIYRVRDGVETVLGSGYVRKRMGDRYKVNPPDGEDGRRGRPFEGVLIGDLVRSA